MTSAWHSGESFRFADRRHAGIALARELQEFANRNDVVVLAAGDRFDDASSASGR